VIKKKIDNRIFANLVVVVVVVMCFADILRRKRNVLKHTIGEKKKRFRISRRNKNEIYDRHGRRLFSSLFFYHIITLAL